MALGETLTVFGRRPAQKVPTMEATSRNNTTLRSRIGSMMVRSCAPSTEPSRHMGHSHPGTGTAVSGSFFAWASEARQEGGPQRHLHRDDAVVGGDAGQHQQRHAQRHPPPAVTATTPQGKPSANINNMACIDMSTIVSIYCALAVWRRMAIQSNHCIEHIGLGGGRHEPV